MQSSLTFEFAPLIPTELLLGLAIIPTLLLVYGLWRRARGSLWRAAVSLVLLLALGNPVARQEDREVLPDIALVVVDESPSQGIGNRQAAMAEGEAALLAKLAGIEGLETRVVRAGRTDASTAQRDEGTKLFAALNLALTDLPRHRLAGVVMLTDGQVHDVPELSAAADLTSVPIHGLLSGNPSERDRRLVIVNAPTFGMVNQPLTLTLRVEDPAASASESVELHFRQQDGPDFRQMVPVGRDVAVQFRLDRAGPSLLELGIPALPQELTPLNNIAALSITGIRDRLRVLLVTGEAHAGERVWRNLLKADPNVDLVHFTILRPPDKQDGTPIRELSLIAFPIRELFEIKLNEFDLVIFDRYRRRGILPTAYFENIANYVARGGALLEVSGPAYATPLSLYRTPLAEVFPGRPLGTVRTDPFVPRLTELGRRHPVTAGLPKAGAEGETPEWSRWFRVVNVEARRGHTLMDTPLKEPLLLLDRVEKGRVAQLYSDHIWLWARGFEGGGPQAELLRRMSHWLMKEPDLEEESLRAEARDGRIEVQRRSLKPMTTPLRVLRPDGAEQPLTLTDGANGLATGAISASLPGIWRVRDGEREALATVGAINPKEFADVRATPDKLAPVIQASGGGVRWMRDGVPDIRMLDAPRAGLRRESAGRDWLGLIRRGDYTVTGMTLTPLAPALLLLAAGLLGLMLMWRRESR